MFALLLLIACGAPPETCLEIEASVADSNTGRCDPCALEELSLDACGTNTCGRPLRVVPSDDGCLALYTVRDANGEIVGTPAAMTSAGRSSTAIPASACPGRRQTWDCTSSTWFTKSTAKSTARTCTTSRSAPTRVDRLDYDAA